MGPNAVGASLARANFVFQSSVRINVGPNQHTTRYSGVGTWFQSSVRINVGPNSRLYFNLFGKKFVSILRED